MYFYESALIPAPYFLRPFCLFLEAKKKLVELPHHYLLPKEPSIHPSPACSPIQSSVDTEE